MNRSTLVKIGVASAAVAAAKLAYSAWQGKRTPAQAVRPLGAATSVGKPADAFSTQAVQHDLSVGEGA